MMQSAAILWHVSLLVPAHMRGVALGMTGAVRIVPIIVFSIVSGVVADHFDRRKIMLLTQSGMALCAAALAVLAFTQTRGLWPVYLLAALSSAFWAFDGPSRQSLIPNLVPREILPNAISLNTIMFEIASIAGSALGGLVIAWRGVGWAYALNALSFLFVIGALLAMRDVPSRRAPERVIRRRARWSAVRVPTPLVRATMLLDFVATFFCLGDRAAADLRADVLRVGARATDSCPAPSVGADRGRRDGALAEDPAPRYGDFGWVLVTGGHGHAPTSRNSVRSCVWR
jgi:MFS family permease